MTAGGLAARQACRLRPDPSRVIAPLFVPGHTDSAIRDGRATGTVAHVLALDDDAVDEVLADVIGRFSGRHRDLLTTFRHHADRIANRLHAAVELSEPRRLVLGAAFTQEFSVEAAALCNPSMVAVAGEATDAAGSTRFVMSVRQIGEGHRSSIGFRSGVVDPRGEVVLDEGTAHATTAVVEPATLEAGSFRGERRGAEDTAWVLDGLGVRFSGSELEARLVALESQHDTRRDVVATAERMRGLAARSYTARFPCDTSLGERVLHPAAPVESNGMEDARFVRFVDDDGAVTFHATYTAFDGLALAIQLLSTTDFVTFDVAPLLGAAAANKGLALFPRRIGGRYAALTRHDGATNALALSDDLHQWSTATPFDHDVEVWESVQVGNCGSPIETDEGWLVLTHGVGPMRTYSIGAWLLDLDEPRRIVRRLREPLLRPLPSEQDGYVPNVVYSCGGLVHDGTLVVPYGIGDASIGFASIEVERLVAAMR